MRSSSVLAALALWGCGQPAPVAERAASTATATTAQAVPGTTARAVPGRVELQPAGLTVLLRAPGRSAADTWPLPHASPRQGACAPGPLGGCTPRIEFALEAGVAWFRAHGPAVQQGWTLHAPPPGDGPLRLPLGLTDTRVSLAASGRSARVEHTTGVWTVGAVRAVDADGRELPAHLSVGDVDGLTVVVEDAGARYPITVDPLYLPAAATLASGVPDGLYGDAVAGLGDINGDGAPDFAVGAPGEPGGAVYLFLGDGALPESADGIRVEHMPFGSFGTSLAGLGDVNADGFDDWAASNAALDMVQVFHGGAPPATTAAQTLSGLTLGDYGQVVLGLGDIDGDGYDDVAVADPLDGTLLPGGGRVDVYRGGPSGLQVPAAWSLFGPESNTDFGSTLAVGDVLGDDAPDLVVGAPSFTGATLNGAVYVFQGSAAGFTGSGPTAMLAGSATQANLGAAVVVPGDLDGDGKDDLIATAGLCLPLLDSGCVVTFHGGELGLVQVSEDLLGEAGDAALGLPAAVVGDVNGDGWPDTAIAAAYAVDGQGLLYLYETPGFAARPGLRLGDGTDGAGRALAGVGDVDADGYDDVLVSAPHAAPSGAAAGVAWLLRGAPTDADEDGVDASEDCDDDDPTVSLPIPWYPDADGDGYGVDTTPVVACFAPDDHAAATGDCDDAQPTAHPGGVEVCDPEDVDEDCSGAADDADPATLTTSKREWYDDLDGDGWGVVSPPIVACDVDGRADRIGDCDDDDDAINPDASEVCDSLNVDENCNGSAEDADPTLDPTDRPTWYHDIDGDSYGDAADSVQVCDRPAGYRADGTDCDDTRAAVNPGATELCDVDDRDEDCDGLSDDADASTAPGGKRTWYADDDTDGYGRSGATTSACDLPSDYAATSTDCDDTRAGVNPGQREVCDPDDLDEDCDGRHEDEDASVDPATWLTWYADADRDGFGDAAFPYQSCQIILFHVANPDDCDDTRADVSPADPEVCDPDDVDENCNGVADDLDDTTTGAGSVPAWRDADTDGYGDPDQTVQVCDGRDGYVFDASDCDDTRFEISPDATEVCDADNVDEDCDGFSDDVDPSVDPATFSAWYADTDRDGFGDAAVTVATCDGRSGYVADATDCDDDRDDVRPDGQEVCDAARVDEDCDGLRDDGDPSVDAATQRRWYSDADHDGHGTADTFVDACRAPADHVAIGDDCDDTRAGVHPAQRETCDAADLDEDCDGLSDDDDPSVNPAQFRTWYLDSDDDGYGRGTSPRATCDMPEGYTDNPNDCDDVRADVYPGATEVPGDGVDSDCDARERCYTDDDGDDFGTTPLTSSASLTCDGAGISSLGGDCDDGAAGVNPGATEVCDAGDVDEDCDTLADDDDDSVDRRTQTTVYTDGDGDGYGDPATPRRACDVTPGSSANDDDCDDTSALAHPGITVETPVDGLDNNCDGLETCHSDGDGDGYGRTTFVDSTDLTCTGAGLADNDDDCHDGEAGINPGAQEVCSASPVDEDCDALLDAADPTLDVTTLQTVYTDADGDGFGAGAGSAVCVAGADQADNDDDCNDAELAIHPLAAELCDANDVDEDCDGLVDDDDPSVDTTTQAILYTDADQDGYGDAGSQLPACDPSLGLAANSDDCDDADPAISPDATEICDADDADEDCDGMADDDDASVDADSQVESFLDNDNDGFGDPNTTERLCDLPADRVADDQDCNDVDPDVNPDATEVCGDGVDGDCNGVADADEPACDGGGKEEPTGCDCDAGSGAPNLAWLAALIPLALRRRRR